MAEILPPSNSTAESVSPSYKYEVSQPREGYYEVRQVDEELSEELNSGSRKGFDLDLGVVRLSGYVDPDDKEIGAHVYVLGFQIGGGFQAGFSTGIEVSVIAVAYNGSVRFFVDGNTLKANVHLKPILPWGNDFNWTGDIVSF